MRTVNQHPDWHDQPMRLNQEELNFPRLVMDDFFTNFQLDDFRQIMWEWLTAVMSSDHPAFDSPRNRGNILFFYERLETLVEACYVAKAGLALPDREKNGTTSRENTEGV